MKKLITVIIFLGVISGLIFAVVKWRQPKLLTFSSTGVTFQYPANYLEQTGQAANRRSASLVKLGSTKPLANLELIKETGAIIGANATKTNFLDYLEDTAQRTLPTVYPSFNKLNLQRLKISDREASIISFSYLGKDKQTTLYMSLFIMPVGNDAYYLSAQSTNQSHVEKDVQTLKSSLVLK